MEDRLTIGKDLEGINLEIANAAAEFLKAQAKVLEFEDALEIAQADFDHIREQVIPALMDSLGGVELTLENGIKIRVKEELYGNLPSKDPVKAEKAYQYLKDRGEGDIVRKNINCDFSKEDPLFDIAMEKLAEQGITVTTKLSCHHSTLKAVVRKLQENKIVVPLDVLGLIAKDRATVK